MPKILVASVNAFTIWRVGAYNSSPKLVKLYSMNVRLFLVFMVDNDTTRLNLQQEYLPRCYLFTVDKDTTVHFFNSIDCWCLLSYDYLFVVHSISIGAL